MASEATNKIKYLLAIKQIDFANDAFKIRLMANGFTFNKDTHHGWANVSANELADGYGYTNGGANLANLSVAENDTDDRATFTCNNVSWTANGGNIGPTPGAIIYDDTPTTPQADPIVAYIDFAGNQTQADGGVLTIANIQIRIS
jgi:hypothetical protein